MSSDLLIRQTVPVAVSSCGHLAQICIEAEPQSPLGCTFQLDECLSQVCPKANECKQSLAEIKKKYKYYYSETIIGWLIVTISFEFTILLAYQAFLRIWSVIQLGNWILRAWRWMIEVFGRTAIWIRRFTGGRRVNDREMLEMEQLRRRN